MCSVNVLLALLVVSRSSLSVVKADEAAAAPAIDMSTLASLASNIGSNPQIMNLVTNFLNPSGGVAKKPDAGLNQDLAGVQQTNAGNEPLRRGTRLVEQQAAGQQQQQTTSSAAAGSPASPLSSLMTMLPGILAAGGGGGGLASLLGGLAKTPSTGAVTNSADQQASAPAQTPASSSPQVQQQQQQQPANMGSAQTVINQVLAAYVSRQIPDELIQLALSGRVPPQLIELALSGQVPPQLIQMVITGQVPMPVINTFLSAMQSYGAPIASAQSDSRMAVGSSQSQQAPPTPGVFSTTRALFEAIFKRDANGRPMIAVPTLLGTIPIKVPSMPNVRSFGQMVGGTISNVASIF